MDIKHCNGCRNDFYNGNNEYEIKRCWSFEGAELVMRKEVHINQVPPWNQKAKEMPACYHAAHFIYVDPERTC